jgi:membrane associated rhomboid family serine protease
VSLPAPASVRPRPVRTRPEDDGRSGPLEQAPVTRTLLGLNLAVFAVQLLVTGTRSLTHLPQREALAFGASYSLATVGEHRWETLVTACFLHDGIMHIGFNMLALWQAGPLVERLVGSARMAPMYLVAGAFGFLLSVEYGFFTHSAGYTVGASGAISGIVAAALVVGWRLQGWAGPLTQAMARWLGFIIAFGLLSQAFGGNIDNAAHLGGAIAGGAIAAMWRRGYRYTERATRAILGSCLAVLVLCIAIVAWRDGTDRFAAMTLQDRAHFTGDALAAGDCRDAYEGLLAVERLRAKMAPVTSLRSQVEMTCGHAPPPIEGGP